jgi:hypothetical protein
LNVKVNDSQLKKIVADMDTDRSGMLNKFDFNKKNVSIQNRSN